MGLFVSKKEKLYQRGRNSLSRGSSAETIAYFEKAAALGHSGAAMMLGDFYREGFPGLTVDGKKALEMYAIAPEPLARFSEGLVYFFGVKGVEQNDEKAFALFQEALNAKEYYVSEAAGFIGAMYFWGRGVEQDYTKALEYLRKHMKYDKGRYPDVDFCYEYMRFKGLGGLAPKPDDARSKLEEIKRKAKSADVRNAIEDLFVEELDARNQEALKKQAQKESEVDAVLALEEKAIQGSVPSACMLVEYYVRASRGNAEYEDERTDSLELLLQLVKDGIDVTGKIRITKMMVEYGREIKVRNREIYDKLISTTGLRDMY